MQGENGPKGPDGGSGVIGQKGLKGRSGKFGSKGSRGQPGPPGPPANVVGPVSETIYVYSLIMCDMSFIADKKVHETIPNKLYI